METKTNTLIKSVVNSFTQDIDTQPVRSDPAKLLSGQAFIAQIHPELEPNIYIMFAHREEDCHPKRAPFILSSGQRLEAPIDFANGNLELWVCASDVSAFSKVVFTVYE